MAPAIWYQLGAAARWIRVTSGWRANRAHTATLAALAPYQMAERAATLDLDATFDRTLQWLRLAAKHGSPGLANGYHTVRGWRRPDVETTGYCIVTLFDAADEISGVDIREVALRAARWEVAELREDGWATPLQARYGRIPLVFDTGQVLDGLVRAWQETHDTMFRDAAELATSALVRAQDADGAWRTNAYRGIPHAYYARVALPLLRAGVAFGRPDAIDAARANLTWVLRDMDADGFPRSAGFSPEEGALTHTLAYTAEGLVGCGVILKEQEYVDAGARIALRLCGERERRGFLPGVFRSGWDADPSFSCLTGNAQVALVVYTLARQGLVGASEVATADALLREAVFVGADPAAPPPWRGAVPGSFPIEGTYLPRFFPLWGAKFVLDALLARRRLA